MFAYCGNSPVLLHDSAGTRPKAYPLSDSEILGDECDYGMWFVGGFGTDGTSALVPQKYPTVTPDVTGAESSLLKVLAATGAATMVGTCLAPLAYPNEADNEKKQSTYIYRYGGTSPSNLTPSQRDVDLYPITGKGLSFSTVPKPGAAKTTIEALNATGVVYAVLDGPTHVSVFPIDGTLEDWRNAGSSSKWTTAVKSVVVKWYGVN